MGGFYYLFHARSCAARSTSAALRSHGSGGGYFVDGDFFSFIMVICASHNHRVRYNLTDARYAAPQQMLLLCSVGPFVVAVTAPSLLPMIRRTCGQISGGIEGLLLPFLGVFLLGCFLAGFYGRAHGPVRSSKASTDAQRPGFPITITCEIGSVVLFVERDTTMLQLLAASVEKFRLCVPNPTDFSLSPSGPELQHARAHRYDQDGPPAARGASMPWRELDEMHSTLPRAA